MRATSTKDLEFPESVYKNITDYHEQKASNSTSHNRAAAATL
jgi:hypothetical protein